MVQQRINDCLPQWRFRALVFPSVWNMTGCILRKISLSKTNPGLNKRKHPNSCPISQIITSFFIALNTNAVIDKILIPIPAIYFSNGLQAQWKDPSLIFLIQRITRLNRPNLTEWAIFLWKVMKLIVQHDWLNVKKFLNKRQEW